MSFIKTQNLVRDNDGVLTRGTASIVDTIYVKGEKYHSKQQIRERLGKIIFISEDKKTGVFLSPTRGLVEYNAINDEFKPIDKNDERIHDERLFPETQIHTVFGDSYLGLEFLEKTGLLRIFHCVFPKREDYERLLCHILHGVLKDGAKITCDNYIEKSFASYVLSDISFTSLRSDTAYFSQMGDDSTRMAFFKSFITLMRKKEPSFGNGCYVDSTPLPNDIEDNPFIALSCHGVGASSVQMRLVLVLDAKTGLPVWFDIIPGNVLDINTVMTVVNDVAVSLDVTIDSLVLDAGYVSKDLIEAFHVGTEKTIIGRMPARRGYPYKTLYWEVKSLISKGKYAFVRKGHTYFGSCREVTIFDHKEYAYVYVDQSNALQRFRDYLIEDSEEFEQLKDKDKDWMTVKGGYFVLLSNMRKSPAEILSEYFERVDIEMAFKTSKDCLHLLPLSKWTDLTIRGKILHDIIDTIIVLLLRQNIDEAGISFSELTGKVQSLMCFRDNNDLVTIETPNRKTKDYYKLLGLDVPAHIDLSKYRQKIFGVNM